MADRQSREPGTRARLIREGLQHHPDQTPAELAELLNRTHQAEGLTFQATEVERVRGILREEQKSLDVDGYEPLFTDRIPPVREHPQIQETPPGNPGT